MSTNGRESPRVTVHYAQTLDGRIATRTGHSQWISCEASLRLAHQLRASHEAVLIGVGTAIADDPRLTVRLATGPSPIRIVADSTLRIPLDLHVLRDGAAPTIIATTERAHPARIDTVRDSGAEVLVVKQDGLGRVDLADLLHRLDERGVTSVMIEGGGEVITSVLRDRLVDRLVVSIAPKVVGEGIAAVNELNILRMGDALTFKQTHYERLGDDLIFDGMLQRSCDRIEED
jgi:riboflavin-specific deaminase-like protein